MKMLRVCRDLGKVSFERAVGCFEMSQLDRTTRFRTFQFQHVSMHDTEGFVQYLISARRQVVTVITIIKITFNI